MICLIQYFYWKVNGKLLACKDCPFIAECFEAHKSGEMEARIYDVEEIHENCTVQVLRNTITDEISVGWYENSEDDDDVYRDEQL